MCVQINVRQPEMYRIKNAFYFHHLVFCAIIAIGSSYSPQTLADELVNSAVQEKEIASRNEVASGTELASKIIEYEVLFERVSPQQHASISAFYKQYSGYVQHVLISQSPDLTTIIYKSVAPIDLLMNNFSKTAEYLGMQVLIRKANRIISIRLMRLNTSSIPYKEW